jgi:hypothetical protein
MLGMVSETSRHTAHISWAVWAQHRGVDLSSMHTVLAFIYGQDLPGKTRGSKTPELTLWSGRTQQ